MSSFETKMPPTELKSLGDYGATSSISSAVEQKPLEQQFQSHAKVQTLQGVKRQRSETKEKESIDVLSKEFKSQNIQKKKDDNKLSTLRQKIIERIGVYVDSLQLDSAKKVLEAYNTLVDEKDRISGDDARIQVQPSFSECMTVDDPNITRTATPPPTHIQYNGFDIPLVPFSNAGGYHHVLSISPTHTTSVVPNASNADILVRCPKKNSGAPEPSAGLRTGKEWQKILGINLPKIYNSDTLATDGFYLVERLSSQFNPRNEKQIKEAARILAAIVTNERGPDFRPDNIRVNSTGDLVLIDFSETGLTKQAHESESEWLDRLFAEIDEYAQQFAGKDPKIRKEANPEIYAKICADIPSHIRDRMKNAIPPWMK